MATPLCDKHMYIPACSIVTILLCVYISDGAASGRHILRNHCCQVCGYLAVNGTNPFVMRDAGQHGRPADRNEGGGRERRKRCSGQGSGRRLAAIARGAAAGAEGCDGGLGPAAAS